MKKKKIIIAVTAVVLCFAAVGVAATCIVINKKRSEPPMVVSIKESSVIDETKIFLTAHRGFSAVAPENTIAAFRAAGEADFFAAECDIYLTKDGVWAISHDEDIKRMTDGKGKVSDYTFSELQQFTVDSGNGLQKYPNEKIPSLSEYLETCAKYKICPEIEIKDGPDDKLTEILTQIDTYGLTDKAIIISFNESKLSYLRERSENVELWYLVNEIDDNAIQIALEKNYAIAFNHTKNDDEVIKNAVNKGVTLAAWTVDDLADAERLYNLGVRYITTNAITK